MAFGHERDGVRRRRRRMWTVGGLLLGWAGVWLWRWRRAKDLTAEPDV